jgi:hypothetical protein
MAQYEPETDAEKFLLHNNVVISFELDRTRNAGLERRASLIESSEEDELEEARVLGKRLFFARSGSTPLYGQHASWPREAKQKTSFCGKSVDPDDPLALLKALEATGAGCFWLFERWEELRAKLVPMKYWRPPGKFKAIRLLGAQPADALVDRRIAEIFLASHIICGVKTDPDKVDNNGPFAHLGSDTYFSLLAGIEKKVRKEWPDLVRPDEKEKARQILIDLVDENVERLAFKLEAFAEKADDIALTSVTRLSFDHSPQGERLRSYLLKCKNGLERGLKNLEKSKAKRD